MYLLSMKSGIYSVWEAEESLLESAGTEGSARSAPSGARVARARFLWHARGAFGGAREDESSMHRRHAPRGWRDAPSLSHVACVLFFADEFQLDYGPVSYGLWPFRFRWAFLWSGPLGFGIRNSTQSR